MRAAAVVFYQAQTITAVPATYSQRVPDIDRRPKNPVDRAFPISYRTMDLPDESMTTDHTTEQLRA